MHVLYFSHTVWIYLNTYLLVGWYFYVIPKFSFLDCRQIIFNVDRVMKWAVLMSSYLFLRKLLKLDVREHARCLYSIAILSVLLNIAKNIKHSEGNIPINYWGCVFMVFHQKKCMWNGGQIQDNEDVSLLASIINQLRSKWVPISFKVTWKVQNY